MERIYKGADLKSGIYKLTNKLNEHFYYGSCKEFKRRWRDHERLLTLNKHHNPKLQAAFNKYGSDAFVFEVIEVTDYELRKLREIEEKYINKNYGNGTCCYNVERKTVRTQGPWSSTPEESARKISLANKGHKVSKETKLKISKGLKGRPVSKETRNKISLSKRNVSKETRKKLSKSLKGNKNCLGRKLTEEAKRRVGEVHKNMKHTEESKRKMSESHKGKKHSKETKSKMSKAHKNITDDTREKMRAAAKKRKPISKETRQRLIAAWKIRRALKQKQKY